MGRLQYLSLGRKGDASGQQWAQSDKLHSLRGFSSKWGDCADGMEQATQGSFIPHKDEGQQLEQRKG